MNHEKKVHVFCLMTLISVFVTQLKKNIDILFFFVVWYVLHLISEIWFVRTNVANVLSHRKKVF